MQNARKIVARLALLCALGAAGGALTLGVWWLVRPSQVVVELTRYGFVWVGPSLWICGLIGCLVARTSQWYCTAVSLFTGACLALLLWFGPGSVTAQSEVVVHNATVGTLTNLEVRVGSELWHAQELAAGQRWEFPLLPDLEGDVRFTALDATGGLISARTMLVPEQPDRLTFRVEPDGSVAQSTQTLWTRLSEPWR